MFLNSIMNMENFVLQYPSWKDHPSTQQVIYIYDKIWCLRLMMMNKDFVC